MDNIDGFLQKRDKGSDYNFELQPLIENFNFYDFVSYAEYGKKEMQDYGGFLVITDKQYVIGYNAWFGQGTHMGSFARTMKDMHGGGVISTQRDAFHLEFLCTRKYLTARIVYECLGTDEFDRPLYSGYINFGLSDYKPTPEQFEVFKKFYEDYNDDLKKVITKYGIKKFYVRYYYKNEHGESKESISES